MTCARIIKSLAKILLIWQITACNDHLVPGLDPSRIRLKVLTQQRGWSQKTVSVFNYDAENRLSSISTAQTPDTGWIELSVYQYDGQNRLIQLQRTIDWTPKQPLPPTTDVYSFNYKETEQISEIKYTLDSPAPNFLNVVFKCWPEYDPQQRVTGSRIEGNFSNSITDASYTGVSKYAFTGKNLTLAGLTLSQVAPSATFTVQSDFSFSYDDKVNPFYGMTLPPSTMGPGPYSISPISIFHYPHINLGVTNLLSLSYNNVLSDGVIYKYSYTYNNAGLPATRKTTTIDLGEVVIETLYYEYESF